MITQKPIKTVCKVSVTRTALMDRANQAGREASAAKEALRKALTALQEDVHKRFGPLPDDEFWPELDRLNEIVGVFRDGRGFTNWPELAANEYFRSAVVDARQPGHWGMEDDDCEAAFAAAVRCVRFAHAYHRKVRAVFKALDALERAGRHDFGLGEDSFGDLCDSFPLHGREACEAALEDGRLPEHPDLGENYMVMNLDDQALRWLEISVRDLYGEPA